MELFDVVNAAFGGRGDDRYLNYSLGMKQRLGIHAARRDTSAASAAHQLFPCSILQGVEPPLLAG